MTLAILSNCLVLALYDYSSNRDLSREKLISKINFGFTLLYTLEIALHLVVQGLVLHEKAFLRNIWNFNDLFVTFIGYLELILSPEEY